MKTTKQGNFTTVCDNNGQMVLATSYDTCLLARKGAAVVLNDTKYSVTTSRHQNKLAGMLDASNVLIVRDCPEGIDSETLLKHAGV